MAQYDVVIIGAGPGGYNAAIRAGQLGLKVACVEGRETLGGTCLNVGCMPSKALLHASEMYELAAKDFAGLGIDVAPKLNLPQMMKQKDESVAALTKGIEFLFKKNKADWIKGWGRIEGPGKVVVKGEDGAEQILEAKDIVIATGSQPASLPGVEVDGKPHRRFHRRPDAAGGSQASAGDRRRGDRAGTGLGMAAAGFEGHRRGVSGPHRPRERTRRRPRPSSAP